MRSEDEFRAIMEGFRSDEPIESDRETLRFLRTWHQYPALREDLTYRGVNVGEMVETQFLHEVVPAMLRQFHGVA